MRALDPKAAASTPRWRGWQNAEHYDHFVRMHGVYDWLNRQLVDFAELGRARRVLDLGCGTGATVRRALAVVPVDAEVVGVDGSPEMVGVARANCLDPRASWAVSTAAEVERVVQGPFDAAIANAAFWQFARPSAVLGAVGRLLRPGATLAFNVPAERRDRVGVAHPFQVALARAIESRSGRPYRPTATRFDPEGTGKLAARAGLVEEAREVRTWEGRQAELIELMRIPAMLAPLAGGLDADATLEALEEASSRVDRDAPVTVPWVFLRYRRSPARGG